jgi:hypothetical protein
MEAGIDPERFWDMTFSEIQAAAEGHRSRIRWQATQTYMIVSCWAKDPISPNELFPGLFDDLLQESKQPWQIMQERVLAHNEDYQRNRGEPN